MLITRTITVAAGPFAPGHLGELTRVVPFELVDAVLEETGARERRLRLLPSRVGVYFLLAMCLFPRPGYLGIWGKLVAALDGMGLAAPSPKALRDLRRRIGIAPLMVPGSCLVISCAVYHDEALAKRLAAEYTAAQFVNHTREDVVSFFAGLELVGPGVTEAQTWRAWMPQPVMRHRDGHVLAGMAWCRA